jgi:hypothetical protein
MTMSRIAFASAFAAFSSLPAMASAGTLGTNGLRVVYGPAIFAPPIAPNDGTAEERREPAKAAQPGDVAPGRTPTASATCRKFDPSIGLTILVPCGE